MNILTFAAYGLTERKQVGILYHWTYAAYLEPIFSRDMLVSSYKYVSFTRNKNFRFSSDIFNENARAVRLVIDGDKLSDRYKIEPYSHPYVHDEYEERINFESSYAYDQNAAVKGIVSCIIAVDVMEDVVEAERGFVERFKAQHSNVQVNEIKKTGR